MTERIPYWKNTRIENIRLKEDTSKGRFSIIHKYKK